MSVGGKVVETLLVPAAVENDPGCDRFGREREPRVWVNTRDSGRECAIYVEDTPAARSISKGDSLWWQGVSAFWTPRHRAFSDFKLRRIGCSGVIRPTTRADTSRKGEG